jgi:hypothetical protein
MIIEVRNTENYIVVNYNEILTLKDPFKELNVKFNFSRYSNKQI